MDELRLNKPRPLDQVEMIKDARIVIPAHSDIYIGDIYIGNVRRKLDRDVNATVTNIDDDKVRVQFDG